MKNRSSSQYTILMSLLTCVIFQACSGTQALQSENVRLYYEDYNNVLSSVSYALNTSSGFRLIDVDHYNNGETRFEFQKQGDVAGARQARAAFGYVFVTKVDTADAVTVRIHKPENRPGYGESKSFERSYHEILFPKIEKRLAED